MNKLILRSCVLILLVVVFSCSGDSSPTSSVNTPNDNNPAEPADPSDSDELTLHFEEDEARFVPGMVAKVLVEEVVLSESEYVGETTDSSVILYRDREDDQALLMTIPELESGNHTLVLIINDLLGELNFEVDEYEPLDEPVEVVDEFVSRMEEVFTELLEESNRFEDSEPVEAVRQEFHAAIDEFGQLEQTEQRLIARFVGLLESSGERLMELMQESGDATCESILAEMSQQRAYWESISIERIFQLDDIVRNGLTTSALFIRTYGFIQTLRSAGNCDESSIRTDDLDSENRIVFENGEERSIDFQLREEWNVDYQEPIQRFIDYVLQLRGDFPESTADYLDNQSGITYTDIYLRSMEIEEISSSSIEGTITDSGELQFTYTGGVMTAESQVFDFMLVFGETRTRFEAVIEGDERPYGGPYDPQFEVDGVGYSAIPVTQGYITGFGAPGPVAIGTDVDPGRLWFGRNACYGFSVNGSGSVDSMGGRGLDRSRFANEMVSVTSHPLMETAPSPPARLIPSEQFHPDFNRTDAIEGFRWGVELDDEGFPKPDHLGRWVFYIEFDEESEFSSGTYLWQEGESEPLTSGLDREYTNSPYCYWRDVDMIMPEEVPVCKTREIFIFRYGNLEVEECFSSGVRHGDYTATLDTGVEVVRGSFNKGLPSDGWFVGWPDGTTRLIGNYNDRGMRIGEWNSNFEDGTREYSVTLGAWEETPFGIHEVLSGRYQSYSTGFQIEGSYLSEEGIYRDGLRDGWWAQFDAEGRRIRADQYNSQRLVEHSTVEEYCTDDGSHCISAFIPRRAIQRNFSWGSCVVGLNYVTERELNDDGSVISERCYEISDDPNNRDNPDIEDEINCPQACAR
ncbi:MAG: hypothetical protein WEA36_08425 [Balneolaceae bacterium]